MSDKSKVFRAHIDISNLDLNYYDKRQFTFSQFPGETTDHLLLKLIGYCLLPHDQVTFCSKPFEAKFPDICVGGTSQPYQIWLDAGNPTLKRLKKASHLSEELFVVTQAESEWLTSKKDSIEKLSQLKLITVENAFLAQIKEALTLKLDWSVVIESNKLSVSTEQGYYSTELNYH